FRLDADRLEAIAATAHTAEQVVARVAARTRRPRPDGPTPYVAPRTPAEAKLADLWAEALRLDRVGVRDDFFALGGNSLQAVVLDNRIQAVLQRPFEAVEVFEAPTVAAFAERLERTAAHGGRCSGRRDVAGRARPPPARRSPPAPGSGAGRSPPPSSDSGSSTSSTPA